MEFEKEFPGLKNHINKVKELKGMEEGLVVDIYDIQDSCLDKKTFKEHIPILLTALNDFNAWESNSKQMKKDIKEAKEFLLNVK